MSLVINENHLLNANQPFKLWARTKTSIFVAINMFISLITEWRPRMAGQQCGGTPATGFLTQQFNLLCFQKSASAILWNCQEGTY